MSKIIFKFHKMFLDFEKFALKTNALPDKSHNPIAVGDGAQGKQSLYPEKTLLHLARGVTIISVKQIILTAPLAFMICTLSLMILVQPKPFSSHFHSCRHLTTS